MIDLHNDIKKSIIRSQHCQRNWDLTKEVPQADFDLMVHSVTQCPSKQNAAFYNVFAITDRDVIEKIHAETAGFVFKSGPNTQQVATNPQTLANVLFVFTANIENSKRLQTKIKDRDDIPEEVLRDMYTNVGVAAGYLNLTSTMLGYSTGCCQCFNPEAINELLGSNDQILLMMGVGWKGEKPRRTHHADDSIVFPTFTKEEINLTVIK